MKYKLIALDLDGTLKNSENKITDETRKILIKAQQLGATIVLASGRPTPGLRHEAAALELEKYEGYLLSFNGAKVMDAKTRQTMFEQRLTIEQAKKAYDEAKKHNLAIMTYYDDAVYTEDVDDQYVNIEGHINDIEIKKAESFKSILRDPINKVLCTGDPEHVASVLEDYKSAFPGLSIYRSAPFFIEVMAPNIDKAASLDKLVKMLHLTKEEVIAFGDGFNDLSLIEYAGCGVAMANAVDEVKERADVVTLSNDEDGIAYMLKKLEEELRDESNA